MYELNCTFHEITENVSGEKKKTEGTWHSCTFRGSFKDGDYTNDVVFNTMYKPLIERIEALKDGDSIKVDFIPGANSWEKDGVTKYFAKNTAFKVYKQEDKAL